MRLSAGSLHDLVANLRDGVVAVDRDGFVVECNRQYLDLLGGYTFEEIQKLTYRDLTPPRWHDEEARIVEEQVEARGFSDPYEKEYLRKDGSVVPLEIQTYLTRDPDGRPAGYWAVVRDITARKQAEAELRLFRASVENATDAIGMATPEGRHFYQNRAFTDLFGDVGAHPPETLYVDHAVGRLVFDALMAGRHWRGEVRMRAKEGHVLDIDLRAYANVDAQGRVVGLVGIHTDISARRRAEARYRSTVDSSPVGMLFYRLDSDDRLTLLGGNPAADRLLGIRTAEMAGQTIENAFPPLADTPIPAHYRRVAATGARWEADEVTYSHGPVQGDYRVIAYQSEPNHMVALFEDITARKRAEEEQDLLRLRLMQAQKLESVGLLAGGIAHDFNNLLMGVFANIEMAGIDLPAGHPAQAGLRSAHKALDGARQLATRLLTFAKGGAPVLESVDLRQRIAETVRFHLAGSNVMARFDIAPDLWPVQADPGQLAEVIANLTLNAKQAMPAGGTFFVMAENMPEPGCHCACAGNPALRGPFVKIVFRDEGVGIPPTIIERIFEPYFSTKQTGNGLGLAIVHGIVRRHEGHIEVISQPGEGATFSIFLRAQPTALRPSGDEANRRDRAPGFPVGRVLLMDDVDVVRQAAELMLSRLGFEVVTTTHGRAAVEAYGAALLAGRRFDVVIMDLTVPGGMGGKEASEELLALDPSAKVIVSSGYSSDPIVAEFERHGFAGRLAKPFDLQDLREALAHVFREP